jgi:rhomboid family GlyGly-CTERM serine protease
MQRRIPFITLAIVAGALLVASAPALQPFLIYDRDQIFTGELWRMFTGHWVHLSTRHLILDVCSLAILGWILETRNQSAFRNFILIAPWLISAISLLFARDMQRYYGLSGLATAAWTFLAAQIFLEQQSPWIPLAMFAAAAAKILFELHCTASLFVSFNSPEIRVAVASHAAGALIGPMLAMFAAINRGYSSFALFFRSGF